MRIIVLRMNAYYWLLLFLTAALLSACGEPSLSQTAPTDATATSQPPTPLTIERDIATPAAAMAIADTPVSPTPKPAPPTATPVPPTVTPSLCPTGTSGDEWLSEDFWDSADLEQVRQELRCGASVNAKARNGFTPLHIAAFLNETPMVTQALLDAGANTEAKGEEGRTPLHLAVMRNENVSVIQTLLDAGANTEAEDEYGLTPLHLAALLNETPMITQALLDAGADIGVEVVFDGSEYTPLTLARSAGNEAIFDALFDHL